MQFEKPCPRLKVFHPGSMSGFQKGFFMIEIVMVMMVVMRVVVGAADGGGSAGGCALDVVMPVMVVLCRGLSP